jgi:hypothetical protein
MAGQMISDPNVPNTEHAWQSNGTRLEELMRGLASPFGKAVARVHVCARCAAACLPHPDNPTKFEPYIHNSFEARGNRREPAQSRGPALQLAVLHPAAAGAA